MAKAKTKKPHRSAKAKRTPRAPAPGAEPEQLAPPVEAGDAGDAAPPKRRAPKVEASLNELAGWLLEQQQPQPVRVAIAKVYGGTCDAARELESLKLIKADERFAIARTGPDGTNYVSLIEKSSDLLNVDLSLRDAAARLDGAAGAEQSPAPEKTKTLGEHVADAKARPKRVSWSVDVGSHVLLLTDGYPPKRAQIRNIDTKGGISLYDLKLIDGGEINGVEAFRIGRDLEAEGELQSLRERLAMEKRHRERGKHLADLYAQQQATEKELAESLSDHRKNMAETARKLADHARTDPGQTDLRDIVGDGSAGAPAADGAAGRGKKMATKPAAGEDKLADQPPAAAPASGDKPQELDALELTLDQVEASRFDQGTASTGKPQQVKPCHPAYDGDGYGPHVLVDVQGEVAVLVPVLSKDEWMDGMAERYGKPLKVPNGERSAQLAAGGRWCGLPVRIGRATAWLGDEKCALLVQLPPKQLGDQPAAAAATGKDAAAGG
jgi:hypothetical protein